FLSRAAVLEVLRALDDTHIRLIVDESFIDFVDGEPGHSLLDDAVLIDHPGLILIKSISKSYGVPGLRLGLLASGDKRLVESVAERLPIWNINSVAESFLQIAGKYDAEYRVAGRALAAERARFS